MKAKYPKVGAIVTPVKPVNAYGHNYARMADGSTMQCTLEPGEQATVIQPKCVSVRGPRPYFTLIAFERYGQQQTTGVYPGEFLVIG